MQQLKDLIEGKSLTEFDIEYRIHATRRMFQRDIHEDNVENILKFGKIIEKYDEDFPLPSALVSGVTSTNRPVHLVVGVNKSDQILVIITVYEPSSNKWTDNFSRRA